MSRQNVEVVRAALDAIDRRDRAQVLALLDPKVEWELVGFLPDQERTRTGREQVWHYLTFLDSEFEDMRIDHGQYVEVGGRVVVPIRVRAKGKRSGIEGEFSFTSVFTVAAGKVLRARNYPTTVEALEAARLQG